MKPPKKNKNDGTLGLIEASYCLIDGDSWTL